MKSDTLSRKPGALVDIRDCKQGHKPPIENNASKEDHYLCNSDPGSNNTHICNNSDPKVLVEYDQYLENGMWVLNQSRACRTFRSEAA